MPEEYRLCPGALLRKLMLREEGQRELTDGGLLFCIGGRLRFAGTAGSTTLNPGSLVRLAGGRRILRPELPQGHFEGFQIEIDPVVADAWGKCSLGIFAPDFSAVLRKIEAFGPDAALSVGVRGEHVFRELYETVGAEGILFARLKLAELFLLLAEAPIRPEETGYLPRGQERLIRHLRDHMISDAWSDSGLQELADAHGISLSQLQKSFKQIYGMPLYRYVKTYRLERAAAQLGTTNRSITEIALDAGYTNASKFSSAFRAQYGITPSEYRRREQLQKMD